MEDTLITDLNIGPQKDTHIFGVFDGHGGNEVAKYIEKHFSEEFVKNSNYLKKDIKKALEENYQKMDDLMLEKDGKEELLSLYKQSKEDFSKIKEKEYNKNSQIEMFHESINPKDQPDINISLITGSTANILVIQDKKLYFANVGDSRSVICKKGQSFTMSIVHKPSIPEELNRIEKAGGWVLDGRIMGNLYLSRSIGDLEYKKNKQLKNEEQMISNFPDVKIENIVSDFDFIVLASDGIWDCKSSQEICDFFSDKFNKEPDGKISTFIEELFDDILATDIYNDTGVGCDNMSCIVIRFKK